MVFIATGLILQVVSGRITSSAGALAGLTVEDALMVLDEWSRETSQ